MLHSRFSPRFIIIRLSDTLQLEHLTMICYYMGFGSLCQLPVSDYYLLSMLLDTIQNLSEQTISVKCWAYMPSFFVSHNSVPKERVDGSRIVCVTFCCRLKVTILSYF